METGSSCIELLARRLI